MADSSVKAEGALRTISEVSDQFGIPQHILRYWETRFPQLRPLQRAGNRRYYRPADVDLARTIHRLLNSEGYTVRGVQKLLRSKEASQDIPEVMRTPAPPLAAKPSPQAIDVSRLKALRNQLASLVAD
jgi:DNA-binding transcriptional MerR regulator